MENHGEDEGPKEGGRELRWEKDNNGGRVNQFGTNGGNQVVRGEMILTLENTQSQIIPKIKSFLPKTMSKIKMGLEILLRRGNLGRVLPNLWLSRGARAVGSQVGTVPAVKRPPGWLQRGGRDTKKSGLG